MDVLRLAERRLREGIRIDRQAAADRVGERCRRTNQLDWRQHARAATPMNERSKGQHVRRTARPDYGIDL